MNKQFKYEDIEQYLRTFLTGEPSYNFGNLLQLVLVGLESLRKHVTDADIREHAHFITDEQAAFLGQLLEGRPESIEWFKDYIGHSSQTGQL